ncbi:hypothetical protein ACT4ZY_06725 [Acinetobacter baumannii]
MDNYKIKVKDEAESKEAQELFVQLGYSNGQSKRFGFVYTQNGEIGCDSIEHWDYYNDLCQELTLPQLRDLVVLKRNDKADGNYKHRDGSIYYITSDNEFYLFDGRAWLKSLIETSEHLIEIEKPQPQDPALISGADALRALIEGLHVEMSDSDLGMDWTEICVKDGDFYGKVEPCLWMFLNQPEHINFRLKPQTIKLELEIPAPYKAKIGGRDDTSFVLNVGRHQYCYKTEEDYTKARDALEAVFDSAVRGTNS